MALLALVAGCGGRASGPVGLSNGGHPGPGEPAREGDRTSHGALEIPVDFRAKFTKMNRARFVSKGHAAGRYEVDIYADDAAKAGYAAATGELPVGARFIKEHFEGAKPGPIMMMEKRPKGFDPEHGDWRYVIVGSTGQLVKDGKAESCAGCHDDAPHDHVFKSDD
ncbi:MAG: hypothetical protein ABIP39_13570 [Polyangiaceae bacterium]